MTKSHIKFIHLVVHFSLTIYNPGMIISKDVYNYPIKDNTYDIVFSAQVMEHVQKIWVWLRELKRITKPGGKIITIMPVSYIFHACPIDCWRIYPDGMIGLMEEVGLNVELCTFESLEGEYFKIPEYVQIIPGNSIAELNVNMDRMTRYNKQIMEQNKLIHNIPYIRRYLKPVQCASDLITIVSKPSA